MYAHPWWKHEIFDMAISTRMYHALYESGGWKLGCGVEYLDIDIRLDSSSLVHVR
jgi:hypothetical protein